MEKFEGFIFNLQEPGQELSKFIDKFMDEKLDHTYNTSDKLQPSNVKWLNAENFESEILNNKQINQCVIEVIKDHCPACWACKINTNILSKKMEKHGFWD